MQKAVDARELHKHVILGGLAVVEAKWEKNRIFGNFELHAHAFLKRDGDWVPSSKPEIIMRQLKLAVGGKLHLYDSYPAIGYFTIVCETRPLAIDADLDLRMCSFYSGIALLPNPPREFKRFMAIALGTVLMDEVSRGTLQPNMLFGLEASGRLGDKDMLGLVEYYQEALGLRIVRPARLYRDIEEGSVIMMALISEVVDAAKKLTN
jgi:hypothetical protein